MRLGNGWKMVGVEAVLGACLVLLAAAGLIALRTAEASDSLVSCRVETDRGVLAAGSPQKVVLKVTLDVPPQEKRKRPAVNLALVLDRSGSMRGEKLEKAKQGAIDALRRLGPKDIFSVVIFDHEVETIVPPQSAANAEWIEERIRNIQARGNTALFAAVSQGASEVRKNGGSKQVNRIILLSDGIANVGPSSPEELGRLGKALLKEDITVTTVGVGLDYNEDLMTRLAQMSDGNTYFVESSQDIPRIFAGELGDVLSIAAKKVRVTIECRGGVRPLRIVGREGRIKGGTIELYLNQLYSGQNKFALIEVEVPNGTPGQVMEIASAQISYEDAFTGASGSTSAQAQASFSGSAPEVEKSANAEVQKHYVLHLNALAQGQAVDLSDRGKRDEAVRELRSASEQLRDAARRLNDPGLLPKAEEMERLASHIEREGMTSKDRKKLQTELFQDKRQQRNR